MHKYHCSWSWMCISLLIVKNFTHLSEDRISIEPATYVRETQDLWSQHSDENSVKKSCAHRPWYFLRRSSSKSVWSKSSPSPFSFPFSSILTFHADYHCKLVPKLRFPVPRSSFLISTFTNILCLPVRMAVKTVIRPILFCAASQNNIIRTWRFRCRWNLTFISNEWKH